MDGIVTYIWLIFMVNVGDCTIYGSYGIGYNLTNSYRLVTNFGGHRSKDTERPEICQKENVGILGAYTKECTPPCHHYRAKWGNILRIFSLGTLPRAPTCSS